jgi:hypothetical protein
MSHQIFKGLVSFSIALALSCDPISQSQAQDEVRTTGDACQGSAAVSEPLRYAFRELAKRHLSSPSTAVFQDYSASREATDGSACIWTVSANVTSSNSAGVSIQKKLTLLVGCHSSKQACWQISGGL